MARSRTLAAIAVVLGLTGVLPVEGVSPSVIFLDEFEDGGLTVDDVPPGWWDGKDAVPGTDAGVSAFAARSGNRGLRITDNADLPAAGTTVAPYVSLGPGEGDRYLRAWVRVMETADAGIITILQLLHGPRAVADVTVAYPPGGILLAAETAGGGYPVLPTGYVLGADWRLLEVAVIDAGTDRSTHRLWVDTAFAGQQVVDQTGWTVDELDVGEPWADDGAFQGTIDLDGVAVTTEPPPSHVVLDAGGALAVGQCRALPALLMSSSGVPAGALRSDTLFLAVDGGVTAATFIDPFCVAAGSSLDVDAGKAEVAFGIRAFSPGTLTLSVSSSDLYGASINLTVFGLVDGGAPDGGTANDAGTGDGGNNETDAGTDGGELPPPDPLAVCGCGSPGGPWGGIGMIALLALALRRSSAPAAPRRRPRRGTSGRRSRTAPCGA